MVAQPLAARRLEILRDLAEVAPDAPGIEAAAASIVHALGRHQLDVPFSAIYLLDRDRQHARRVHAIGSDTSPTPASLELHDPASPWPVAAALAAAHPAPGPEGAMMMPLGAPRGGARLGVLVVGRDCSTPPDATDDTFFQLLQHTASSVLFRARALEEDEARTAAAKRDERALRRQSEHLGLLWETAAVIVTSDDPDTMLRRIFARIREGLELDTYLHFVVEGANHALKRASYGGISAEHADRIARLELGEGLSGTIALERRPVLATGVQTSTEPRLQQLKAIGIRTFAGYPLIASGRLLGTLAFASRERDAFRPDELEFLETISHYVTAAYEQFRLIEELRDADRKKDEFLATLAHELRNPLAPIRTGLRVLQLAPDSSTALQSLEIMERQSAQLTRLIDDLLDVSRITQGKLQVRKSYVELADVVQSALETARPFVDEARHELVVTLPPEPVLLCADLTRLAQVLSNLLSNAAKYTPRGGRIELQARRDGGTAVVCVRDNGLGIEAEMRERVFEKFTQIDRMPDCAYTGLGIGLTLVKTLVEMHGGTVTVHSEGADKGSEFTVRVPCVVGRPAVPRAPVERPIEPAPALPKRRVLVVDDNQDAADLLSVAVQMLGHEVRTAHDGVQAIEVASVFHPGVVLMDLGMPRMNGYEAARRMRAQPWGERITLVALTGWGQDADKRRTREAGFDHHLVKPADPTTLEAILSGEPVTR